MSFYQTTAFEWGLLIAIVLVSIVATVVSLLLLPNQTEPPVQSTPGEQP